MAKKPYGPSNRSRYPGETRRCQQTRDDGAAGGEAGVEPAQVAPRSGDDLHQATALHAGDPQCVRQLDRREVKDAAGGCGCRKDAHHGGQVPVLAPPHIAPQPGEEILTGGHSGDQIPARDPTASLGDREDGGHNRACRVLTPWCLVVEIETVRHGAVGKGGLVGGDTTAEGQDGRFRFAGAVDHEIDD